MNFLNSFGILSYMAWCICDVFSVEILSTDVLKAILLIYLFIDYLVLLNQYVEIQTNLNHCELIIQIIMFCIFFIRGDGTIISIGWKYVLATIMFVLYFSEIVLRRKYNKKYVMPININKVDEKVAMDVMLKEMLSHFNLFRNEEKNKQDIKVIKIAVLNAASFLVVMLSFFLRIVLEIINMFSEVYSIKIEIYIAYIILMEIFFVINLIKGKHANVHIVKTVFQVISTAVSVYIFVFKQTEEINFPIVLMSLYFAIPFFVEHWRTGRKYKVS